MILITLKDHTTCWTSEYSEKDGWINFTTEAKSGRRFQHRVNASQVQEIMTAPDKEAPSTEQE